MRASGSPSYPGTAVCMSDTLVLCAFVDELIAE
jgi:hypothetical protein